MRFRRLVDMFKKYVRSSFYGLLRKYIPKAINIDALSEEERTAFFDKLNKRPRKCLGWKTPFDVFYNKVLHLV